MGENVKVVRTHKNNLTPIFRPNNLLWTDLNAPNKSVLRPIIETNIITPTNTDESTSKHFFHGK